MEGKNDEKGKKGRPKEETILTGKYEYLHFASLFFFPSSEKRITIRRISVARKHTVEKFFKQKNQSNFKTDY